MSEIHDLQELLVEINGVISKYCMIYIALTINTTSGLFISWQIWPKPIHLWKLPNCFLCLFGKLDIWLFYASSEKLLKKR